MVIQSWHSQAHSLLSLAIHSSSLLSSAIRAQLYAKRSARQEELSSAQRGQLGQKSSALRKEVSSSRRRGQLIQESSALPKEVSSSNQRGQLIQESLALPKEVSSARRARPQLILSDPSEQKGHNLGCRGPIWVIRKPTSSLLMGIQYTRRK